MSEDVVTKIVRLCEPLAPYLARRGESLMAHCAAVAIITADLITYSTAASLGIRGADWKRKAYAIAALAGALHDIGKISPDYQGSLIGKWRGGVVRHELMSFIIAANTFYNPSKRMKPAQAALLGSILYHHHGLYDITEKINEYLAVGKRVWPDKMDKWPEEMRKELNTMGNVIAQLIRHVEDLLEHENIKDYLSIENKEVLEGSYWARTQEKIIDAGLLETAASAEARINRMRHVITPLLSNLMIADNIAAYCALMVGGEDEERGRITTITKVGIPVIRLRARIVIEDLVKASATKDVERNKRTEKSLSTLKRIATCIFDVLTR